MSAADDRLAEKPRDLVRFREMTVGDVAAVAAVERAAYPYPWSDGIFRDCLRVGYTCRVAELRGEVVAYGVVAVAAGEAHILNICVLEDLRGRGLGRQMLNLLLERASDGGAGAVYLEVRPSNTLAISLYQSVGFVVAGRRRAYYQGDGGREDALVLKLDMSSGGEPFSPC